MRICHIVGDSKFGGGSRIVLHLAKAAIDAGHEVSVVGTDSLFVAKLQEAGARPVMLVRIPRSINPWADLAALFRLHRHFRHERYDLVHTHTSKAGMIGRLAAKTAGVPAVVHTVHGFAFHEQSRPVVVNLVASLERLAAHWCDRLVTVSHFHRDWAIALDIAAPTKIVAIPNGIAPPSEAETTDRRAVREALGVGRDEQMVLAMGRLATQKGMAYLIDAAAQLRDHEPSLRFFIAGDGPLREELESRIITRGVEDSVRMLGFREDIEALYHAADIVAQPSLWEGLSISLLEAMARGKPVVTTDINSNREVAEESGAAHLVPTCDSSALAEILGQMAANPNECQAQGHRAVATYRERYTLDRMQDAYLKLYEALIIGQEGQ